MKTLITYLAEDNAIILENLIDALREIADVKVDACSATQAEASRWLDLHDGTWHLAIVDLFLRKATAWACWQAAAGASPTRKLSS